MTADGLIDTFARTPDVKYVFSHGGGAIPYLASRFELAGHGGFRPGHTERPSAAETFRGLCWDTSIAFGPAHLRMLQQVAGTSQIVYASDYPFSGTFPLEGANALRNSPDLTEAERNAGYPAPIGPGYHTLRRPAEAGSRYVRCFLAVGDPGRRWSLAEHRLP